MGKPSESRKGRPAVLLDRDGVVNVPPKKRYVTSWEEFRFLPGVLKALKRLKEQGTQVFILSNQAGVGRGWIPRFELRRITRNMLRGIREAGGDIQAVYYCTHAPEDGCSCRKPKPGLLRRACRRWPIDLSQSVLIGDNPTDILMGRSAGCRTILVLSGKESALTARRLKVAPDRIAKDLGEAVRWILRQRPAR